MDTRFTYPRETVEYVYFDQLTANGETPVVAEYSLTAGLARPTNWQTLSIIGGRFAFLISGLLPGWYTVWARIPDNPEQTVIEVGRIEVT